MRTSLFFPTPSLMQKFTRKDMDVFNAGEKKLT